ncbi:MAG TPA: UvrD-helicase domain-containing protein [Acidobacteriaceae bacterium]|nr:UvrD-helicase domain-containing protein [Acidobacteriaceae bacterium]
MAEPLRFPSSHPPDADARRQALDIRRSFIVEAPAGSGKTGLLIQRLLKLLTDPSVEQPEQVLAITFTLKATAEMRDRVLAHLSAAAQFYDSKILNQLAAADSEPDEPGAPSIAATGVPGERSLLAGVAARWVGDDNPPANDFQTETLTLAHAVLARDRQLGWQLLDHPHRLNIRTIDSVCAQIARTLPVLSGSGGRLTPADDANPLHREAARRTLLQLGSGDATFDHALRNLLLHRDGNLADCESLLAEMLSLRDQWGDLIPLTPSQLDDAWLDDNVRPRLELALDHAIQASLAPLAQAFPAELLAELTALAADLADAAPYDPEIPSPIALCAGLRTPPRPLTTDLDHWRALIHLLIIDSGELRKERGINKKTLKFNYNKKSPSHPRLVAILNQLNGRDDLLLAFQNIRSLPPAHYPEDQWAVAKSLFRILSRALVELQLVFAVRNQCDFTEFNLLARHALAEDSGPEDLAAALGARLQHLLVDEMQDTSTGQYDLIELLTRNWDGYSQTVFLVGDPRQSIYLFRQARVERFIRALHTQRLGDLPLTRLRLTANFRSQRTLVDQFNRDFTLIFPEEASPQTLPYTPAQSTLPASAYASATVWHTNPLPASTTEPGALFIAPLSLDISGQLREARTTFPPAFLTPHRLKQQQARRDAQEICRIAREWLAKPLPSGRIEPWRIAVLVRSRTHLNEVVAALKQEETIPFRAVEIESLDQRQEVLDLVALTRALLHPADRVASLALLRSPCCGLSLADLHLLTGADDPTLKDHSIQRLMAERAHLLPEDSRQRLARVSSVLESTAGQRARLTTAQLVERAWHSLGGDVSLSSEETINTIIYFELLDKLQDTQEDYSSPLLLDSTRIEENLKQLYAQPNPIPPDTSFVELLTIHKAKGLEWDVVLVPSLERQPATNHSRLLTWSELEPPESSGDTAAHIMLAPIAGRGEPSKALNNWLNRMHRAREAAERKRLFYVACTRARQELHLFAAPQLTSSGEIRPRFDSLLQAAWPAAEPHFAPASSILDSELGTDGKLGAPFIAPLSHAMSRSNATNFHVSKPTNDLDLAAAAAPSHSNLQRLPLAFDPAARFAAARAHKLPYGDPDSDAASSLASFSRPEGSFAARTFGNVVHAALEIFADRIANGHSPAALLTELPAWGPRITALLRADGLAQVIVNRLARDTRAALENVLRDPDGLWLLAPNSCAANELALTAWPEAHDPRPSAPMPPISIRIDRIFRAGPEPRAPGDDVLWIVDYKTSDYGSSVLDDFLAEQRAAYAPQLETYARVLTQPPHPPDRPAPTEVRLALYYPTLPRLLWWPLA